MLSGYDPRSDHRRGRPIGLDRPVVRRNGHDPELIARDDETMERAKVLRRLRGQCDPEDRTDPPAVPTAGNSSLPLESLLVQASAFVRTQARKNVDNVDPPDDLHSVVIASANQQGHVSRNRRQHDRGGDGHNPPRRPKKHMSAQNHTLPTKKNTPHHPPPP